MIFEKNIDTLFPLLFVDAKITPQDLQLRSSLELGHCFCELGEEKQDVAEQVDRPRGSGFWG